MVILGVVVILALLSVLIALSVIIYKHMENKDEGRSDADRDKNDF